MKKLVMVVDDDQAVVKVLKKLLLREGYLVLGKTSAESVLTVVDAINVDLFIVDVMMPNIDGIQLCKRLRANKVSNKAPIVMFSAHNNEHLQREAIAAGGTTFLSKREMTGKLLPTLKELLGIQPASCVC